MSSQQISPIPQGRRYAKPLAGSGLLVGASLGGLLLFIQLYMKSLGASTVLIGLISSLNAAGTLIGSLFWGAIADRVRRRPLLFITAAALSAAILVMVALPRVEVVLVTAFVRLFLFAGFTAVTIAIVSGASAQSRRGKNVSYVSSARAFGLAVGSMTAGFVLEWLGFRFGFLLIGLLAAVGALILLGLPQEPAPRLGRQRGSLQMIRAAGLIDLYVATMLRQMAVFGTFSLLYIYMDTLAIPTWLMGIVGSFNMLTQTGALLVFGRLADRFGRRRIFMLGFALSVATPCLFVLVPSAVGMALGYVSVGLSFSSLYIGSTAHIGDRVPPERQGTMLGLYESSRGLGGLFGPVLAGILVPTVGYTGMFLTMAGIALLGLLVMTIGYRPRRLTVR